MSAAAQRGLALGGFALVLAASLIALLSAGAAWLDASDRLARAERLAAQPEPVIAANRYLTTAVNRAEASVALQGRINSASGAGDVALNRMRILPEDPNQPGVIIAEVDAEGDWLSLARFTHALEMAPPGVIIREFRASADMAAPQRPMRLTLRVEARFAPPAVNGREQS